MKAKALRVTLLPAAGNWLVCVACGRFACDFGIVVADGEQQAGIHKRCMASVKRARRSSKAASTAQVSP